MKTVKAVAEREWAFTYFDQSISSSRNAFEVEFINPTPEAGFIPGDNEVLESYDTIVSEHVVSYKIYQGDILYVSSEGTSAGDGDGNEFKLVGDGIAVGHQLINSLAYNNNDGITSNSNPSVIIKNAVSYGNKGNNISLYGKGSASRDFVLENVISMAGAENDDISEMPELASDSNYLSVKGIATNKLGLIYDVNRDIIKDPHLIYVGQTIRIP